MEAINNLFARTNIITIIYFLSVTVIGLWALGGFYLWLQWLTKLRKRRLKTQSGFEAIATETPLDNPEKVAKANALKSIESHFTITRKLLMPAALVLVLTIVSAPFLNKFPAAVLSLVVGAATVVVGVAAKPIIENIFAGLVIASSRVVNIGDTVKINDIYGTVEDITPAYTTIKVWDWRRCVVPNALMLSSQFINYTLNDEHVWAFVEFWVDYDADIDEVKEIAVNAAKNSENYAGYEDPRFWVMDLDKEGLRCWVAAWAAGPNGAWELKTDVRAMLAKEFKERKINSHSYNHDLRGLKPQLAAMS